MGGALGGGVYVALSNEGEAQVVCHMGARGHARRISNRQTTALPHKMRVRGAPGRVSGLWVLLLVVGIRLVRGDCTGSMNLSMMF